MKLLAEKGVRNIDQYNKLFDENGTPSLFGDSEEERPLPYIVIIIDELADLMMLDSGNVEESITRAAVDRHDVREGAAGVDADAQPRCDRFIHSRSLALFPAT